jgi:predicted hydrocarbon binding protein
MAPAGQKAVNKGRMAMVGDMVEVEKENQQLRDLNGRLEWRLNQAKMQYRRYLTLTIPLIPSDKLNAIFQDLGKNCARLLGWASKYKGNPEGFFKFMKEFNGEDISFSEDKSAITVITKNRPCDCPLMKGTCMDGTYCDCSIGWQKETYETILGKKVNVIIKESCFRGADKCVFEIEIDKSQDVSTSC